MEAGTANPAEIDDLSETLINSWKTRANHETEFGQRNKRPHLAKFVAVHGLAAHTYRVGQQVLSMLKSGLVLEAMPLLRLCYESALTAHWLAQTADGAEALMNRDNASRRAAAKTLREARSGVLRSGADQFPGAEADLLATTSNAQARNFEQLCKDLAPGGADAYAYYRLMSWYSHPGAHLVDRYVVEEPSGVGIQALRLEPAAGNDTTWRFFLAASLVWAARAVDFVDVSRAQRSELRAAARVLGIPEVLQLTHEAQLRIAREEQARRRQRWKGRRSRNSAGT
jgi:hypothetical protein